ncbi:Lrp/AsnC family transcriptional regulator [Candidatus Micrarchaeota archaeon]|nr:Lrp/AsnC family transcriptional regulator [Candidatus Micrarchaeota archaeon]
MVYKLDNKSKKLLYELDLNARQPSSSLAKKLRVPKSLITYKISKLKKEGIIKNFYTLIDTYKMGYISVRIYITFQYASEEKRKEIANYFIRNENTWWVSSTDGWFDLAVIFWIKNMADFTTFWNDILERYRNYFENYLFTIYLRLENFNYVYFLDEKNLERKSFSIGCAEQVEVDKTDMKILKVISNNARAPLVEIAKRCGISFPTAKQRLKKLEKSGVIVGYRVDLNFRKLGYEQYKVDIFLKDYKRKEEIANFARRSRNLVYIDYSAGMSDVEVEYHFKDRNEFYKEMSSLLKKFPEDIKRYKYVIFPEIYKIDFVP